MASNPKMEYQVFLCIFQKNSAMATLGLKEMGKFLWEVREKGLPCWLSQFTKIGKMQKKVWYYEKWVGRHVSFPRRRSVKYVNFVHSKENRVKLVSYLEVLLHFGEIVVIFLLKTNIDLIQIFPNLLNF